MGVWMVGSQRGEGLGCLFGIESNAQDVVLRPTSVLLGLVFAKEKIKYFLNPWN